MDTTPSVYPIPRAALLFMATVDEARRTNEGPFRALAPLFSVALEAQRGEILSIERAVLVLQPIMGMGFTHHTFEQFIPSLEQTGWLVRVSGNSGQTAYRVSADLVPPLSEDAAQSSEQRLDDLYIAFQEFLKMTAPLLSLQTNAAAFKWNSFLWATSLDGTNKSRIRDYASSLEQGGKSSLRLNDNQADDPQKFTSVSRSVAVELAAFANWLLRKGRPEFQHIAALTELGLALEFVQELREPTLRASHKVNTVFVLDSPVLLDMLGLSGPSRQESLQVAVKALAARGAALVTLPHCLEEMAETLRSILQTPAHNRHGLTGDAMRRNPALEAIARGVSQRPDQAVKQCGVQILSFDPKSPINLASFPDDALDRFRNSAGWHAPTKLIQRSRDALSVAFVMRRRNGIASSDLFDSKFILVTRNSTFTQFADIFVRRNSGVPSFAVGPAVEVKTLAAHLWMRFGSAADRNIPQLQLISACDRLLASNGELLRKAERKLVELKGRDVATAILSSDQAILDLVIATSGDADVLDGSNAEEIFRIVTRTAEEKGREHERAIGAVAVEDLRRKVIEAEEATENERRARLESSLRATRAEAEGRQASEEARRLRDQDERRIEEIASLIASAALGKAKRLVGATWAVGTVLGGLTSAFFSDSLLTLQNGYIRFILAWAGVIVAAGSGLLGVRFMSGGRTDLAAFCEAHYKRWLTRRALLQIRPDRDRERVQNMLELGGEERNTPA